jgi:hypothetical protein
MLFDVTVWVPNCSGFDSRCTIVDGIEVDAATGEVGVVRSNWLGESNGIIGDTGVG